MRKDLIRLANWRIGFFRYWTRFGSKPRSWNAASWSGVDLDSSVKCFFLASGMRMVLRVMVPRWSMRPSKLWTGWPLALRLIVFLDFAVAEGSVETTGEERSACAALSSVSWNNSGARSWRRCHST
jgi:hypothetical protein